MNAEHIGRLRRELVGGRLERILFGGDYNPEQWNEAVRAEDAALMRRAGVNLVTLGIFGWGQVEKAPGEFDFSLFDRVMDELGENGVAVSMATMTASPPPWLARLYPDTLPERADGTRLWPGARQHYCPSSPVYREHATRLVERLAERYGDHDALALWHIGNEYGCHVSACHCDVSAADFQHWLRGRYGDLDALNEAWSTTFWSQHYERWDEILPPRSAPSFCNPSQQLDFARFSSDALLDCYLAEKQVLRAITPDVPVTTNLLSLWKPVDAFRWAEHMDIVSHDSYPDPHDPRGHVTVAYNYDVMRSAGEGRPWLLMEQAPSAVNWRQHNTPKSRGRNRLMSWQAVAQGADSVVYFQWRASRGGAEKYHSAMVPHGGADTRIFREVCEFGEELAGLGEIAGTTVAADVALLMDWSSWWALELDSHPSAQLRQEEANLAHYAPLFDAGVTCDVVPPTRDLSPYKLVVVPALYMLDERHAAGLTAYVRDGGHLVVSFFSGIVDSCDRVHLGGYPAPLREVLGVRVEEFWPLHPDENVVLEFGGVAPGATNATGTGTGTLWSEEISTLGAEVVARFGDGELAGLPAVTRHRFGRGTAWYLGTRPDKESMRALMDAVLEQASVEPVLQGLPADVQAARRTGEGGMYLILLNHSPRPATVALPEPADQLAPEKATDIKDLQLPPHGVAVLRERAAVGR
jgi:beta-galactosidase